MCPSHVTDGRQRLAMPLVAHTCNRYCAFRKYVLRVIYREARVVHGIPGATTSAEAEGGGRERSSHPTIPKDDPGAAEMLKLATAGRGLVQRTRVLSKRLNSLCALHPQLMWELEEGRRLRPEGGEVMEPLGFPDPFELGTLEVNTNTARLGADFSLFLLARLLQPSSRTPCPPASCVGMWRSPHNVVPQLISPRGCQPKYGRVRGGSQCFSLARLSGSTGCRRKAFCACTVTSLPPASRPTLPRASCRHGSAPTCRACFISWACSRYATRSEWPRQILRRPCPI